MNKEMEAKIAQRIAKARGLQMKIEKAEEGVDTEGMVRESTIADVLVELMECLKDGDSLAEAIETIQVNF